MKLFHLSYARIVGTFGVRSGIHRYQRECLIAKAHDLCITDVDRRKRGDQRGIRTLVVHAVNDEC